MRAFRYTFVQIEATNHVIDALKTYKAVKVFFSQKTHAADMVQVLARGVGYCWQIVNAKSRTLSEPDAENFHRIYNVLYDDLPVVFRCEVFGQGVPD